MPRAVCTAPLIPDIETQQYRESNLRDLYDAARLVDSLEHLHFFSRSLVARDMPDLRSLDINTAYACLAGTAKHVFAAASEAAHVREIAALLDHHANRASEIDAINGMAVELGKQLGVPTPYNEVLSAVIRQREREFGG